MSDNETKDQSYYLKLGQKIPLKEKISFGFGSLATALIGGIVGLYLTDYYVNEIKIQLNLFIIAMVIYMIYNAINDIIFGQYADNINTESKSGRRIPFIKYGAPHLPDSSITRIPIPIMQGNISASTDRGEENADSMLLKLYYSIIN